jgi:hypothetical protein
MRRLNIRVFGWKYIKWDLPIVEANEAIERVTNLDLDGYVIDAGEEYKQPGKALVVTQFMDRMRVGLSNTSMTLCLYRYPSYHPLLPWGEFLEKCDVNMSQVY